MRLTKFLRNFACRTGGTRAPTFCGLLFHELFESLRIDGNEQRPAAGEHFAFLIEDLAHIDMSASAHADLARFHAQRFVQRHGPLLVHRHP
jgi:hypothetical protein